MIETQVEQILDAPAAKVWALTGDFGGLRDWMPMVTDCWVDGEGARDDGGNAVRTVDMMDGSIAKEALLSRDDSQFSYRYAILEAKSIDKSNDYQATFTVVPLAEDRCKVVWSARFLVPADLPADKQEKARQQVQKMYGFLLQHLSALLKSP